MYTCLDCSESFNAELLADMDDQQQPHCLNCKSHNLTSKQRALELGHSFLLSDRYSSRMGAIYLAEHSNKQMYVVCNFEIPLIILSNHFFSKIIH